MGKLICLVLGVHEWRLKLQRSFEEGVQIETYHRRCNRCGKTRE